MYQIYIKNINTYMTGMCIKKSYVSLKTGINEENLSHILNGEQQASYAEVKKIAAALGKEPEFFLSDNLEIPNISEFGKEKIVYNTGFEQVIE